jgi:hypothetical protein
VQPKLPPQLPLEFIERLPDDVPVEAAAGAALEEAVAVPPPEAAAGAALLAVAGAGFTLGLPEEEL